MDTVEALLHEASKWLASRGIDQWQFPPHRDRILRALSEGDVFLGTCDGHVIATLQVDTYADPEFWTPNDQPDDALLVHRMVVTRESAGIGVGGTLLDWAAARAAAAGKSWLRLDAWKDNRSLHRYYEIAGFALVRVVDLHHRGSGALFQRPAKNSN
ncbi:GNAT family N-acetyltransferase [Streptomyces sp. NPDC008317]|uniref:GNAT family N-acetyltransferase n=1 Tax=Streptomyces sp. NPDC008317 TaxID=3364827 RepID=UPI0036E4235C